MRTEEKQEEMLHLDFKEGQGHLIHDISGCLPEAEIRYRFRDPAPGESMPPGNCAGGKEGSG